MLSCVCAILSVCVINISDDEWSQFGGPFRNFQQPAESIFTTSQAADKNPIAPLRTWSHRLNVGDASPVTCNDLVFVTCADFDEEGIDAHRIDAIQLSDGGVRWSKTFTELNYLSQDISERYPVRPLATPVVVADKLYLVGYGGTIRCLECETGSLVWQRHLVEEWDATPIQYGFSSSPWCDDKSIIVACGGPQALLLSLELDTGKERWRCHSGNASYTSFVELKLESGETQLIYAAGDQLVGFDPTNGQMRWIVDYPESGLTNAVTPIAIAPIIHQGQLLIRSSRALHCVPLKEQVESSEIPSSNSITSMDAMWGEAPPKLEALFESLKRPTAEDVWPEIESSIFDPSLDVGESTFARIATELEKSNRFEIALKLADAWESRSSTSIAAKEFMIRTLRQLGRSTQAEQITSAQMVKVNFNILIQNSLPNDIEELNLTGNSATLGNWKGAGLPLTKIEDGRWTASIEVPKGMLEYKVSGGGKRIEVTSKGRRISNRRKLIISDADIEVIVAAIP